MTVRYVLFMWWSFYNNSGDMHVAIDVQTYVTLSECKRMGQRWLDGEVGHEIQTRHAYSCSAGDTKYMRKKIKKG